MTRRYWMSSMQFRALSNMTKLRATLFLIMALCVAFTLCVPMVVSAARVSVGEWTLLIVMGIGVVCTLLALFGYAAAHRAVLSIVAEIRIQEKPGDDQCE